MPDHIQEAERFMRNIRDELEAIIGGNPLITIHEDTKNHPLNGKSYEVLGPQKERMTRIDVAGAATNEPYHVTIEEHHQAVVDAAQKLFSTRKYRGFGTVRIYGEHVEEGIRTLQTR